MPIRSFLEIGPTPHIKSGDASDFTRLVRLSATVAPYVNNSTPNSAPTLGWKSNEVSAGARLTTPIYGKIRAFIPNR